MSNKLSSALYAIKSVKNILPSESLCTIYHSLFHSHLTYAIQIWGTGSKSNLTSLHKKQKNAVRLITGAKYNTHTEPLFKKLKILPLPFLFDYLKIQFMQRFSQNLTPPSLSNTWIPNRDRRNEDFNLRNDDEFYVPFARTEQLSRFPFHSFPLLWNSVPEYLKIIRNRNEFDCKLKTYFLDKLKSNIMCNRLLCPSCHLQQEI